MPRMFAALALLSLAGCTSVEVVRVPSVRGTRDLFVTSGDLEGPYHSLGLVQATRKGVVLFGFAEPAATDLQGGFADLARIARSMGGDAVINARFEHTQYTTLTRAVFAVLFFIPLPAEVTVTGEVVRFQPPPARGGGR